MAQPLGVCTGTTPAEQNLRTLTSMCNPAPGVSNASGLSGHLHPCGHTHTDTKAHINSKKQNKILKRKKIHSASPKVIGKLIFY